MNKNRQRKNRAFAIQVNQWVRHCIIRKEWYGSAYQLPTLFQFQEMVRAQEREVAEKQRQWTIKSMLEVKFPKSVEVKSWGSQFEQA